MLGFKKELKEKVKLIFNELDMDRSGALDKDEMRIFYQKLMGKYEKFNE